MKIRKFLSIVLILALCFTMLPMTTLAADEFPIYVSGVGMADNTYLANGAAETTTTAPTSGGYAHYASGTLTLNNYSYSGEGYEYDDTNKNFTAIYSTGALNVVLVGQNSITSTAEEGDGITSYAALTISGDGSLDVDAYIGIQAREGDIVIDGGTFNIINAYRCIYTPDNNITINNGSLNMTSSGSSISTNYGNITINGGTLDITSKRGIWSNMASISITGGKIDIDATVDGGRTIEASSKEITLTNVEILSPVGAAIGAGTVGKVIKDASGNTNIRVVIGAGEVSTLRTVSFNANGGEGTMTSVEVNKGSYTLPDCTFTAPVGKQFKGWAYTVGGEVITGETITVFGNVNLYAVWENIPAEAPTLNVSENLTLASKSYTDEQVSVTVTDPKDGYTYTYQWYDATTKQPISGATNAAYTIPNDLAVGSYSYYCVATATRSDNGLSSSAESSAIAVTVNKAEQSISFAESTVNKTYGDEPFTIAASHTVGDGAVTYSSTNDSVAEVDNSGEVTIKKADAMPVTITATAAETENYKSATATYSLKINQKELTIQPKAVTVKANAAAPTFELEYIGLVSDESLTPSPAPEFKLFKSDGTTEITAEEAVKTAGTYIIKWTNMNNTAFTGGYENNYDFISTIKDTAELKVESSGGTVNPPVVNPPVVDPPTESVTIPISGEENSIEVDASVSGSKATVDEVDLSKLDTVIGEDVDTGVVTIDFSGLNKDVDVVEIPSDVVKQIAEAVNDPNNDAESLEVVLSDGTSIEFDAVALGEKAAQAGGLDITISIENSQKATLTAAQKNIVGSNTAYDINVTSGGKAISDMGGMVTVHAPYELKAGEVPHGVVVYYVDDNGNKEACETSYDSVKKRVNWKTDHLSLYMIGYDEERAASCPKDETCPMHPYTDVSVNAWYHDGVHYAIENGLMQGTAANLFAPNGTTTRAQIVTILHRLEGKPVCGQGKSGTFGDVPDYQWYTEAVEWATAYGIVEGYGDAQQSFAPNAPITREQLAAILWRYAKYKGYDVSVGESTNILSFEDASKVSEYAVPAMQWAYGADIIQGVGSADGTVRLDPQGSAIRSQAATIITRFCENITP